MQEHEAALDCHVGLTDQALLRAEDINGEINGHVRDRLGISDSKLEFEHEDRAHQNAARYGHDGAVVKGDG